MIFKKKNNHYDIKFLEIIKKVRLFEGEGGFFSSRLFLYLINQRVKKNLFFLYNCLPCDVKTTIIVLNFKN
jgi:hypothetical protein